MKRWWMILLLIVVVIAGIGWWKIRQPDAVVEIVQPRRGDLQAFVEEQAVTELPQDYLVATPIAGRLEPIHLREGDPVEAGQVVARLDTEDLESRVEQAQHRVAELDARIAEVHDNTLENNALVEVNATIESFDQTVAAAVEKVEAAKAVADYAESEVERVRKLHSESAAPDQELREKEMEYRRATAEYRSDQLELAAMKTLQAVTYIGPKFIKDYIDHKRYKRMSLEQQRNEAEAELKIARRNLERAVITSEIDGIVLERLQTRRQFLPAGTPLLTLGNLDDLEIIAEVLTQRATRISRGDPVEVFGEAILDGPARGKVLRVYPAGFKKISSLGVEQQRVNVAIGLRERPKGLGVGYRVQVRIVYAKAEDAILLPRTALFRGEAGRWEVMVVRGGVTALQQVELGLMNDDNAVILEGLTTDDRVVARPSRDIVPAMRVEAANP